MRGDSGLRPLLTPLLQRSDAVQQSSAVGTVGNAPGPQLLGGQTDAQTDMVSSNCGRLRTMALSSHSQYSG